MLTVQRQCAFNALSDTPTVFRSLLIGSGGSVFATFSSSPIGYFQMSITSASDWGGNRRRLVSHANCQEQKEASQWQRYEFSCYAVSDFNVTRCSRKYHRHVYRVMRAQAFGHFASKRGTKWQWETCLRCRGSGELAAC